MPATKKGIYHNLKESNYLITNTEIMFFFSSRMYRKKFMDTYRENRKIFSIKMSKIAVELPLNMETLADITLYKTIEKRGFRAWLKGVDITWDELHKYVLRKMIDKNTLDWYETQKPKLEERLKIME